jgi:4-amino-4-deoxy-L-arabinose transferase-like glycosyltransferase
MLAWTFVGFGFLTKMLQAFLVLPGFALVYLLAAPTSVRRRVGQLVLAGVALVVSAGWWVAAVELWPKSSRPYIGGSQNNSMLNLIFGYNGFGRLTGDEAGSVGGGGQGAGRWGPTGWTRMFNPEFGGQVSWLLPAALILLVAGLVWRGKAPRTDRARAGYLLWGSWLLVTGIVFSLSKGIIHPYYTVALAPAIGALVGMGATTLWRHRHNFLARAVLAVTVLASAIWAKVLLDRAPNWHPELRTLVLVSGIAVAVAILVWSRWPRSVAAALALTAVAIGLTGPTAYALSTAATTHTGAIPSAGPTVAGGFGRGGMPVGGAAGAPNGVGPGTVTNGGVTDGRGAIDGGAQGQQGTLGQQGAGRTGGIGGLLNGSSPSAELVAVLDADSDSYTWVAATIGANQAAGYQLATGDPVMAIGGFNGTDPWPTLAVFQQYVAEGKIHYFLGGGGIGGGGQGGSSTSSEISAWVAANFTAQTVGGVTLYDLTA